jgi:protein-disulfide isomerase
MTRVLAAMILMIAISGISRAQTPPEGAAGLSRAEIEAIVRQYLLTNPQVIVEALTILEERQKREADQRTAQSLAQRRADLERDPLDPVTGNPQGDVTLVEFFDYRCGFCKQVHPEMLAAVAADGRVRVVHKQFPILGPASVIAARAALASQAQGRYVALHEALMAERRALDETVVMDVAKRAGLDLERLRADMARPEIETKLRRVSDVARALEIRGTPAFIVGGDLVPGAIDRDAFRALFAKARAGG